MATSAQNGERKIQNFVNFVFIVGQHPYATLMRLISISGGGGDDDSGSIVGSTDDQTLIR